MNATVMGRNTIRKSHEWEGHATEPAKSQEISQLTLSVPYSLSTAH